MNQLWWLSFCDGKRPTGQQFLGACIVSGTSMIAAVQAAHANGVNPGGEVMGHPIAGLLSSRIPGERIGVLMDRAQCEAFDKEMLDG